LGVWLGAGGGPDSWPKMLWLNSRGGTGEEGGGAGEEEEEEGLEPSYMELEGFIRFSFCRLLQNQTRTTSCKRKKNHSTSSP
jgi:hypothetical protein